LKRDGEDGPVGEPAGRRYLIVSESDLAERVKKLAALPNLKKPEAPTRTATEPPQFSAVASGEGSSEAG
jgi:hypothetical protein